MTVYIVLMLLALAGYAFSANASEINRKRYLCLVFSAIVIVAMLRSDQIGIDLSHYYNKYYPLFKNVSWDKLQSVTISGDWELGFCAFCKIIGQISTSTQCFVIFTSLFSIIPYAHFIYRNSDDVVFSTVFFLGYHIFMMSMNVIRQAMAVGVILLGLEALKRKQYVKFAIYVVIATFFHTSAIIALLFILCDILTFKKNTVYILTIVTVGFSLVYRFLFEKIISISSLSNLYGLYSASGAGDSGGYITFHTLGMFAIAAIIFVYCSAVYNCDVISCRPYRCGKYGRTTFSIKGGVIKMHRVTPDTTVYWSESMLMYSVYLAVLFRFSAFIINVTARFSLYFIPFLMIAFPHALNKVQNQNNRKLMKIGMITAIIFFFLYLGFTRAGAMWGTVPYHKRKIVVFTNGAIDDYEFACFALRSIGKEKLLEKRPTRPVELVDVIATCEYIISFRLHSLILAAAYDIPSIGLVWDSKVTSFFETIKREEWAIMLNDGLSFEKLKYKIENLLSITNYKTTCALKKSYDNLIEILKE